MLTQENLKKLFDYAPDTGYFTRLVKVNYNTDIGDIAGSINDAGYLQIRIDGRIYLCHRLVWLFIYGYFPENSLDHIDRDKTNNRLNNLREVSQTCNNKNSGNLSNNTSGVKGVSSVGGSKTWKAQITVNRRCLNLGRYGNFEDAVCARLFAEQCLNWENCEKKSSAKLYMEACCGAQLS